jgi:hypothetical protein
VVPVAPLPPTAAAPTDPAPETPPAVRGTTSTARTVAFGLELAAVDAPALEAPMEPWPVVALAVPPEVPVVVVPAPAPAPLSEVPVPEVPELPELPEVPELPELPEPPELPELPEVPVADDPVPEPDWS